MRLVDYIKQYVEAHQAPSPIFDLAESQLADAIENRMEDSRTNQMELAPVLVEFLKAYRNGTCGDLGHAGNKVYHYFR